MKTETYEERGEAKASIDKDEMMQKMQAAGTPGPEHKALDAFKGNWKAEVKCWMEPGSSPSVSQATSKVNWTMGGRFLEEEFHGEMMGKPFTGRGLFGFDNTKRKFQSVWMDDMNTAMYRSEGRGESGNKVITLEGRADCPGTGQKDVPMKQVFRVLGPDKHVLEMFNGGNKSMEITYTRQ
jgi:hypothetical protein